MFRNITVETVLYKCLEVDEVLLPLNITCYRKFSILFWENEIIKLTVFLVYYNLLVLFTYFETKLYKSKKTLF